MHGGAAGRPGTCRAGWGERCQPRRGGPGGAPRCQGGLRGGGGRGRSGAGEGSAVEGPWLCVSLFGVFQQFGKWWWFFSSSSFASTSALPQRGARRG